MCGAASSASHLVGYTTDREVRDACQDIHRGKFIVVLTSAERERLSELICKGKAPEKTILKALVLLQPDQAEDGPGWPDARMVEALEHFPI